MLVNIVIVERLTLHTVAQMPFLSSPTHTTVVVAILVVVDIADVPETSVGEFC